MQDIKLSHSESIKPILAESLSAGNETSKPTGNEATQNLAGELIKAVCQGKPFCTAVVTMAGEGNISPETIAQQLSVAKCTGADAQFCKSIVTMAGEKGIDRTLLAETTAGAACPGSKVCRDFLMMAATGQIDDSTGL